MNNVKPTRRRDYDLLRVLSMAAVVYLHTAAISLQTIENPVLWQFSNWLAALSTAAVPLFFMLSGGLLLGSGHTDDPSYVLRHRLPKVLVPGLFWSGLVIAGTWFIQGSEAALPLLLRLPHTTALTPYWFLYALVPMYLLSPLLKRMAEGMKPSHWKYLLGLWGVLSLARKSVYHLVPEPYNFFFFENLTLTVSAVGGYLGYFMLGAYLERMKRTPSRRLLWAVVLCDWVVISLGTWYYTAKTGVYSQHFLDYRGIFAAILSAAIFLLAKSYLAQGKGSGKALILLAGCSFGVYLSHPFAIKLVEVLLGEPSGIPAQLLTWVLAVAGSVLGVVVVQSIKPLCFLVTGQKFSAACKESNLFALLRR